MFILLPSPSLWESGDAMRCDNSQSNNLMQGVNMYQVKTNTAHSIRVRCVLRAKTYEPESVYELFNAWSQKKKSVKRRFLDLNSWISLR